MPPRLDILVAKERCTSVMSMTSHHSFGAMV
ncbi:hypothetical protein X747_32900 [Mesorhizobium sp. LNJC384A00]|nr:hypothetical protein X747_32900 [Mesorhizobium sp. LNJC384A00]